MRRTTLKRKTPLRTYARLTSRTPIRKVSKKRQRALTGKNGYLAFARNLRAEVGRCELGAPGCNGQPESVHHVIKLSQSGALVPGPKADVQGQVFMVACLICNGWVENNAAEARKRGWVKSNPLKQKAPRLNT